MGAEMAFTTCYPLWGLVPDLPGPGADRAAAPWRHEETHLGELGGFRIDVPDRRLWHYLANGDAFRESVEWGPPEVPACLITHERVPDVGYSLGAFTEYVKGVSPGIDRRASRVVTAMRLHKDGWFLDPVLSERIYTHYSGIVRDLGPYYLYFWDDDIHKDPPFPRYRIGADGLAEAALGPLGRLVAALERYEEAGANSSLDLALANFNRAYACGLTATQQASLAFTALDAVLLGMSRRQAAEVRLATFRERVEAALRLAGSADPGGEADWLDRTGREFRNAIAHGRAAELGADVGPFVARALGVLRQLLVRYLGFSIAWRTQPEAVRELVGDPFESVAIAFNVLLGEVAHGRVEDTPARTLGFR